VFVLGLLAGCSSHEVGRDTEIRVNQHFETADSLEHAGNLRGAILEYTITGQLYPQSKRIPEAMRKLALLSLDPRNPSASDSAAILWLRRYITVSTNSEDRSEMVLLLSILRRFSAIEAQRSTARASYDSLTTIVRRQNALLSNQQQRVAESENELKQTKKELTKLKEVDVRLSRQRRHTP